MADEQARPEQIGYNGMTVPVVRESCAEAYIALRPQTADPYIVAPRNMDAADVAEFFAEHADRLDPLREKMLKRLEKTKSDRCTFQTGDVAYVMGRPFMIAVQPLGSQTQRTRSGNRGRTTVKYSVDTDGSLLTLLVAKAGDYSQRRMAFMSFANAVVAKNAAGMVDVCRQRIMPDAADKPWSVRMRDMSGRFASLQGSALWLSHDIVPYPVDCLVYVIWRELMPHATIAPEEARRHLEAVLPGWERAARLLAERAKPYSNQ